MTPTTKAGAALLADWVPKPTGHEADCDDCKSIIHDEYEQATTRILAIEAEAVAAERARLAEAVGGLSIWMSGPGQGFVDRAAVLRLIDMEEKDD